MDAATTRPLFGALVPELERRADGAILVRTRAPLPDYATRLNDRLDHWARTTPDAIFLAQRAADGQWRRLSYRDTNNAVRRLASALLSRDLGPERPVAILSGNSIAHALMALACMEIGVPYCAISTAYSLISRDFGKLHFAFELMTPGLVFAAQSAPFATVLETVAPAGVERVVADDGAAKLGATRFDDLLATPVSSALDAARAKIGPDTIAKFLLTSGSTGFPKAVINTQRMLTSNQVMIREALAFLKHQPPVLVDWLPWSHTFGGNHNIGIALYNGGAFYIDDGKPMPGGIDATANNLRDIAPTIYFNVPKGFEALLPHLEADSALRENFFSRLNVLFYAGAGLSQPVWDAYRALAQRTLGHPIRILTSLGSTETAPAALTSADEHDGPGIVGLPLAGMTMKLVEIEGKLEARLKGPNITPGYWRDPALTAAAFDADGFYRLGDALAFADPDNPAAGFVFDGRLAEDFKLATGTWVSVGPLRNALLAGFAPLMRDVVIAGHDRDDIAVMIFPDIDACRRAAGLGADTPDAAVLAEPRLRAAFRARLRQCAATATGSSHRVMRAILLAEPASIDRGEATDKGSLNQRAVLAHRPAELAALYADPPPPAVISIDRED